MANPLRIPARAAWLGALLALLATGCSLFQPTEPEPPSGTVVVGDYTTPEKTVETLALALEAKALGQAAYEEALAEDEDGLTGFRAFHLPGVIQRYAANGGTVPPNWDRNLERNFFSSLVQLNASDYGAQIVQDARNAGFEFTDVDADTAALYRKYTLLAFEQGGDVVIAQGYAYLGLRRGSTGGWRIIRWQDIPGEPGDSEDLTFGALRLELQ